MRKDIIQKASYALCFGFLESGKFKVITKTMQHKDAHGVYNIVHALLRTLYTYSVGSVLLVQLSGQYQSLKKRNSNIAARFYELNWNLAAEY